MDVGDYYSKSVESFRRNWKIAVPQVIASALTIFLFIVAFFLIISILPLNLNTMGNITPSAFIQMNSNALWTAGAILLVIEILIFIITAIKTAATVGMAESMIMKGSTGLDVAWKAGKKYFPRIFVVSIIMTILTTIVAIPLIWGFYLLLINEILGAFSVLLLGSIIFIVGYVLISLIFFVFNQSIVIGQKSVIDSIKDSFQVFWDNKLTVFLVALINAVIGFAIGFVLGIIISPLTLVTGPLGVQVVSQTAGFFINIILIPYFTLVITYMYIDLKKGFAADEIEM